MLDENPRQDSIPIAEAISLASNAGQTALHLSASLGFERLSKELLVRGANPNQRDVNGYTALHFAALYGHIRCAQTLIQGGADGDIITKGGRTAREIALDSDHAAIAQLLGAYVATELDVSGPAVERRDNEHDAPPQELSRPRTGDITSQSDHTGRDVVPTEPQESANNAEDEVSPLCRLACARNLIAKILLAGLPFCGWSNLAGRHTSDTKQTSAAYLIVFKAPPERSRGSLWDF